MSARRAPAARDAALLDAAAQATRALGTAGFWRAFVELLEQRAAFDNALVAWYMPGHAPQVLLEYDRVDTGVASAVPRYVEGMYMLDPFFQAFANGLGTGLYRLREVASDRFRQTDYYAGYFRDAVGQDELQLVCRAQDGLLSVSLGAQRRHAAAAARALGPLLPWLLALLEQQLLRRQGAQSARPLHDALAQFGAGLLSAREAQVARLTLQGHSLRSMAERLGISRETVKSHRRHVFAKLGVRTPSELFARFAALTPSA